jgi:hypothetical protein
MKKAAVLLFFCLSGCSMFKHSTKTDAYEEAKLEKAIDSRSLVLKTALKETNTLTYNPDGSVLQFQQIQEEVAQSEAVRLSGIEKVTATKDLSVKESVPMKSWLWLGVFGLLMVALLIYLKFIR